MLVDLKRHRVLDLLPDRAAATLAAWLRAHPGVEIVSRDRAGAYVEGATLGAPSAVQVADLFHLLRNLTEAVERALERHRRAVHAAVPPLERPAPVPSKRGGPLSRRTPEPRARDREKTAEGAPARAVRAVERARDRGAHRRALEAGHGGL